MSKEELSALFSKYLQDKLSPEEVKELFTRMSGRYDEQELDEILKGMENLPPIENSDDEVSKQLAFNKIMERLEEPRRININWVRAATAAAVIGIVITIGLYLFNKPAPATVIARQNGNSNKAVLVLANGQEIVLDHAGNVAKQGNVQIVQSDSSLLVYKSPAVDGSAASYNTLKTPRGSQFQIVLPDGTHVWLNAASSLRYPASFTGNNRDVQLEGEAYFEVAKNDRKPFIVEVKDLHVTVLGTAFNIMAYNDEPAISTTLVQGAVKVNEQLLQPGEQATFAGNHLTVSKPEMKTVLAWKDGKFWFDGADIKKIMRQISRWYDVEVKYKGDIQHIEFTGIISRTAQASQILEALEQTGNVQFKISGKNILVQQPGQ